MKRDRGYVLITVLLLLTLAATVTAAVCRSAVRSDVDARTAEDELQRRWGTISCRDAVLPDAFNILERDQTPAAPVNRLHVEFKLGIEDFAIDLGDEQAKVNINTLVNLHGKSQAEQAIGQLVASAGGRLKPRLRLAPGTIVNRKTTATSTDQNADTDTLLGPALGSWSEVFPDPAVTDLLPTAAGSLTRDLTLWGNGSLNIGKATPATISVVCGTTIPPDQIAKLVALRGRLGENATLDQLLAGAHLSTADSLLLQGRLTTVSTVHSLWIVSRDRSAVSRTLFVQDATDSENTSLFTFRW